jgi:hypothetical protein
MFRAGQLLSESNPLSDATRERLLVKLARRDVEHLVDSIFDAGWIRIPRSTVPAMVVVIGLFLTTLTFTGVLDREHGEGHVGLESGRPYRGGDGVDRGVRR